MRSFFLPVGLILSPSMVHAQDAPADLAIEGPAFELPEAVGLPPSLADAVERDGRGDAVEERSLSDQAMALALAAVVLSDWDLALIHAERAAAAGEPLGATLAGHILLQGLSARGEEEAAAVRWLRRAGEQGEADALVILSRLAAAGRGGLEPFQARAFLATAAESGDARAAHEYGLYLMEAGDPGAASSAIDWLRLASESGRVEAFSDYAEAIGDWIHGPGDLASARLWYERAAHSGDGLSAAIAGSMYMQGDGGPADPARGAGLIQMGAELGSPAAMGSYALILFQGAQGVPADPISAASWALRGAELGDGESQFLYAYALATADGVDLSYERAFYWVRRAAAPRASGLSDDADRAALEAALRRVLPGPVQDQIEAEAAADSIGY